MRRRMRPDESTVAEREMVSYLLWCERREFLPYGHPSIDGSLREAVANCKTWLLEREVYAKAHRIAELEMAEEQWPQDFWDAEQI
jgi:hypothetical protein